MIPILGDCVEGKVVIGNLLASVRDENIPHLALGHFHRRNKELCLSGGVGKYASPFIAACSIVWNEAVRFQLQGCEISRTTNSLVNVQSSSAVHETLFRQRAPALPSVFDGEGIAQYLLDAKRRKLPLTFGSPNRLVWLARRDDEADIFIPPDIKTDVTSVRNLLNFLGLGNGYPQPPLLTTFIIEPAFLFSKARRPTTFDGIDGNYFKQAVTNSRNTDRTWGRTINLNSIEDLNDEQLDGAAEIVLPAIPIEFVESCICLAPALSTSKDMVQKHAARLLGLIKEKDWTSAGEQLVTELNAVP